MKRVALLPVSFEGPSFRLHSKRNSYHVAVVVANPLAARLVGARLRMAICHCLASYCDRVRDGNQRLLHTRVDSSLPEGLEGSSLPRAPHTSRPSERDTRARSGP